MRTLLPWRQLELPINWHTEFSKTEFSKDAPLHLEVGFGDGRFTLRRALQEPEQSFVALEISSVSISKVMHKLKKSNVQNVRILKLGAQFAVKYLFAPHSLSSITVNFPDPWPKGKHIQNRLLQRSFYALAASRLQVGGTIRLATDHPEYLAFAKEEAMASDVFELRDETPPEAVFETKYALKWKSQGKPLYYQVFVNRGAEIDIPKIERSSVPHALLSGQLPKDIKFSKFVLPYADGYVIVHEVLNSLGAEQDPVDENVVIENQVDESQVVENLSVENQGVETLVNKIPVNQNQVNQNQAERWLFRVTIDEVDLKQQVLIVAKKRKDDEYIVRFEPFGDPVLTPAARGAVHAVTEWLLTLPTLQLKARNY